MKREDREFRHVLRAAMTRYLRSGGTVERAHALLDDVVAELPREGQLPVASSQSHSARPRQPDRGGGSQQTDARKGHMRFASIVREPTERQRRVLLEVNKRAAVTILDSFKIRDGRAIGDVLMGEVERLRAANAVEAHIFAQIKQHAVADSSMRVRDVIKPKEFQRIQQRAAELANAA